MGIELRPCGKCGGKGKLSDFDHTYDPKNKSNKFLNIGNGLKTWAKCKDCERFTERFRSPIEAINKWNDGEIYNSEEWSDKLDREYIGKVYSEYEIKNYILQTDFEKNSVKFVMTDTSEEMIYFDKITNTYAILCNCRADEKDINRFIENVLEYFKSNKFRVVEIKQVKPI